MNHRDVWFVGLLALVYLYIDGSAPTAQPVDVAQPQSIPPLPNEPAPVLFAPVTDACPRDLSHQISLRKDGAMWCLGCDEGFFPAGIVI